MKLYSVIRTARDASELQSSPDALVAWSEEFQLTISSSKSAVLYLGQSNVRQCYNIKQASVSSVSVMRDLGILIDNKLAMSQHIHAIVNKAQSRASLIFKCFHSKHRATFLKAFVTYVRPLVEYASPVWFTECSYRHNQNRISTTINYQTPPRTKKPLIQQATRSPWYR